MSPQTLWLQVCCPDLLQQLLRQVRQEQTAQAQPESDDGEGGSVGALGVAAGVVGIASITIGAGMYLTVELHHVHDVHLGWCARYEVVGGPFRSHPGYTQKENAS